MPPIPYHRLLLALLALLIFNNLVSAASPTSFCKCTCFTNSTIIPLDAPTNPLKPRSPPLFPRHAEQAVQDGSVDDELDELDPGLNDGSKEGGGSGSGKGKEGNGDDEDRKEYRAGNCNDCNRQFCLDYNLPICKGAGMEDAFAVCFQRDSRKDEAVVFIFIFATVGLLGWAAVKPWVGKWLEGIRERRSYIPVLSGDT